MRFSIGRIFIIMGLLAFLFAGVVQAATFTKYSDFMDALVMPANVLDLDSMSYGETIASGDTVDGITFTYDFGGVEMMVTDDLYWPTTSSPNLLGTVDGDMFQGGDGFGLSFAPASAVGMFFISADEMFDDDITLTAGGDCAELVASDGVSLGYDDYGYEWYAYFLGIVDVGGAFTDAIIRSFTDEFGPYFLYNVDDINTSAPVPEPGTILLLGTGLIGFFARLKHRFKA